MKFFLLASFALCLLAQPSAGEPLDADLAPACGGRLVIRFSLRCRDAQDNAARRASVSLMGQPPANNAFVTDVAHNPGLLFRANGGIQCSGFSARKFRMHASFSFVS
jgi:hypothetical protein